MKPTVHHHHHHLLHVPKTSNQEPSHRTERDLLFSSSNKKNWHLSDGPDSNLTPTSSNHNRIKETLLNQIMLTSSPHLRDSNSVSRNSNQHFHAPNLRNSGDINSNEIFLVSSGEGVNLLRSPVCSKCSSIFTGSEINVPKYRTTQIELTDSSTLASPVSFTYSLLPLYSAAVPSAPCEPSLESFFPNSQEENSSPNSMIAKFLIERRKFVKDSTLPP